MRQASPAASLYASCVALDTATGQTTGITTSKTTAKTRWKTTCKTTNQTTCPTTGGYPYPGYHFGAKAPKYRHFSRFKELPVEPAAGLLCLYWQV